MQRHAGLYLVTNHPTHKQQRCTKGGQRRKSYHKALTAVKEEKRVVKRQLRALRRKSDDPEEVRLLAVKFHKLVRQHSKLIKEQKCRERTRTMHQQRQHCHKNLWCFSNTLCKDDKCSHIKPAFDEKTAESFFRKTYEPQETTFERPPWMKPPQPPSTPLHCDCISIEEVEGVLNKCRPSSTPSPTDQISYSVLKHCPSLMPALLKLYNLCWATRQVPRQWKVYRGHPAHGEVNHREGPIMPLQLQTH